MLSIRLEGEKDIFDVKKILLPTDGSTHSLKAAEYAAEISKQFESETHILNVITKSTIRISRKREEKSSVQALEETKDVFDRRSIKVIVRKLVRGNPAEIICKIAEEEGFDLIVIGSRGLSGMKAFFLGGVSDKVSRHAICPVLIVR
ncbi:universal stress protein [Candidatus Bathyarchaeota archaeon]|nr:MAG: universal stress protein [Candidatus Bathyarchaeota archaeon]